MLVDCFTAKAEIEKQMSKKLTLNDLRGLTPEEIAARFTANDLRRFVSDNEPPGFFDRLQSGFATTPQGEVSILRRIGYDAYLDNGRPMVRTELGTQPVDPDEIELGDLADMVGRTPRTLLSTLAGLATSPAAFTGAPIAAASAAGVTGAAIEQGIGNMLGSEEGVNVGDLGMEALTSAGGDIVGRGLARIGRAAVAPFKGAVTGTQRSNVIDEAARFDTKLGTEIESKLPLSAQTTSPALQNLEERVRDTFPATIGRYEEQVTRPYNEEVGKAFDRIVGDLQIAKGVDSNQLYNTAVETAVDVRQDAIGKAYDELQKFVAPEARVVTSKTEEAVQRVMDRTGAGGGFQTGSALDQDLAKIMNDVGTITSFKQLDDFRKRIGNMLRSKPETARATGLDAHLRDIYGGLADDAETFFMQGTRLDDAQMRSVLARESDVAARQAAQGAVDPANMISLSQAIERVGGLNTKGLPDNISPRVMRRLRGVETSIRNATKVAPQSADLVAEQLRSRFPQLRIETQDDLLEALRRDDTFYKKIAADPEEEALSLFARREQDIDFRDVDMVESAIGDMNSEELMDFAPRLVDAVERGELSQFNQQRLDTLLNKRIVDLEGGSQATKDALAAQADEQMGQAARLPRELPAKARQARLMAKEAFDLDASSAANLVKNPDKTEGIATRVMKSNFQPTEVIRLKQLLGAVETPSGVPASKEGVEAFRNLQAEVLEQMRKKSQVRGDVGVNLSGAKMESFIESIGGEKKMVAIFGQELARDLLDFSKMLTEASTSERFRNMSKSGRSVAAFEQVMEFFRRPLTALAGFFAQRKIGDAFITPGGRRYLTEGVLQDATGQQLINVLGRASGQVGARTGREYLGQ